MKKIIIFISFLFLAPIMALQAQVKKVKAPQESAVAPKDIKDKLVELALKNPSIKVRDYEKDKTVYELNKTGTSWLNYVTASANFNDVSLGKFKGTNDPRNQLYYPLWNVGINVPLGTLFGKPNEVKIARRNVEIATAEQEVAHRQIKTMILSKYHDFLMTREMLTMQNEMVEDDYAIFSQAETKLASGSISYEEYSAASKKYNDDRTKKLSLERDLNVFKLEIEEIIGMRLEDVLAQP